MKGAPADQEWKDRPGHNAACCSEPQYGIWGLDLPDSA